MTIDEIRRAASVARDYDKRKSDETEHMMNHLIPQCLTQDVIVQIESCADSIFTYQQCADAVREAIRAAL